MYNRRRNEKEYFYFSIICFASFILSLGNCLILNTNSFQKILLYQRGQHVGALILLPVSVHFALIYTHTKSPRWRLRTLYGLSLALLFVCFTNLFIQDIPKDLSNYTKGGIPGLLYQIYAIIILPIFFYALYILWNKYRKVTDRREQRLILPIIVGGGLYVILGLGDTLITAEILKLPFLPAIIADFGPVIFCLAISYCLLTKFALTCNDLDKMVIELKTAQERLILSERLAAVGETASKIVHEIKNPLAGIRLQAELCQRALPSDNQHPKEIIRTIDWLTKFLSRLLNLSKPAQINLIPTEVDKILDNALKIALPEAEGKNIEIEKSISSEIPLIQGEPDQIREVFLNILLNAIQAMPDGGTLKVKADEDPHSKSVLIEINDTGCGIEENDLNRIFDPFFTTKEGGSGLGLAVTRKIIVDHEGTIEVKSMKGEGSTFIVRIPYLKEPFLEEG
ncbi:MAG: ATP-binding protein [bacterium]